MEGGREEGRNNRRGIEGGWVGGKEEGIFT